MTKDELQAELKARFITARDRGEPATIGLIEVMELLSGLGNERELSDALDLVLADLTEYNAHT